MSINIHLIRTPLFHFFFFFFIFLSSHTLLYSLTPQNHQIILSKDIYLQHDGWNNSIYTLTKSGDKKTRVYTPIFPNLSANLVWLKNGTQVKSISPESYSATSKSNFIPVEEGEEFFIQIFGIGKEKSEDGKTVLGYTPVLLLDSNDNYVNDFFYGLEWKSTKGNEIKIPPKAKKMHISYYSKTELVLQKIRSLTDNEIDEINNQNSGIIKELNSSYNKYKENPTVYKKIDKAFISFMHEDLLAEISEIVDLFISKNIPLNVAADPKSLSYNSNKEGTTRLDVIKSLLKEKKGEILAHVNSIKISEQLLSNFTAMYSAFILPKKIFANYQISEVNGIILNGGSGQIIAHPELEKWASGFYLYADSHGLTPKYTNLILSSVYYHRTVGLNKFKNDLEQMKSSIESDISKNNFAIYTFKNFNDISKENLTALLDFVKNKEKKGLLEIGTYKDMYEKYAISLEKLISTKTSYYVASDGKSTEGTNISEPMNFETMLKKRYISGDKIYLKRGDIFYGQLDISLTIIDDKNLTILPYGGSSLPKPKICGYKIISCNTCWEKYLAKDNIYRIDLTNTKNFDGIKSIDSTINQIGFVEDKNKKKYFNLVRYIENITQPYDFSSDGKYLYFKTNSTSKNPYEELGELKLATKIYLLMAHSQMTIKNIHFIGTGGHAIDGNDEKSEQIEITHCIFEDIGGSYLKGSTRFGNAIQFYASNCKDILIHKNIIRNVYDVGFTIQGSAGSGLNVYVQKNIFIMNSQDSEIWENEKATGVYNYYFQDNLSINQGRCWGYDARPDKSYAGHILFWGYYIPSNTKIRFYNNYVYNPFRIYYIAEQQNTTIFFKTFDYIDSDYNKYFIDKLAWIFRYNYRIGDKDNFIKEFNKDKNSEFNLLSEVNETIIETAKSSINYNELKGMFSLWENDEDDENDDNEPLIPDSKDIFKNEGLATGWIVLIVVVCVFIVGFLCFILIKKKLNKNKDEFINNFLRKSDLNQELIAN